jgi:hypothetical protein
LWQYAAVELGSAPKLSFLLVVSMLLLLLLLRLLLPMQLGHR